MIASRRIDSAGGISGLRWTARGEIGDCGGEAERVLGRMCVPGGGRVGQSGVQEGGSAPRRVGGGKVVGCEPGWH